MATQVISGPARLGRIWFHWRGVSPVPLFLVLLLVPPQFRLSFFEAGLVLVGIALAEALRVWAVGYAGSATRTRGDSVPQLVHAGPFRYVRNPLYIANILMYTLTGILFGSYWMAAAILVYSALQYHFIVSFEEETLVHTFGDAYQTYRVQVPRWLPSFGPAIQSSDHVFSLRRALVSEKSTFVAFAALLVLWMLRRSFIG